MPGRQTPTDVASKASVLKANEAFYLAFRTADFARMVELWSASADISVCHPNWPGILGRQGVFDSWHHIMVEGDPPNIRPIDAQVIVEGRTAIVFCIEALGDADAVAANTFVREHGEWRLFHHQAQVIQGEAG